MEVEEDAGEEGPKRRRRTGNEREEYEREMDLIIGERTEDRNIIEHLKDHLDFVEGHNSKKSEYDVCEIFSPPRTCQRARMKSLRGGGVWMLITFVR